MQGEYRGDFTRDTFQPWEHFSRVLMQQGRVQLDADFNEQTSILLYYLRSLAADVIGPHGGSADGFHAAVIPGSTTDFAIGQGRYYVDGILCEVSTPAVPATSAANSNKITLQTTGVSFAPNDYIEIIDASSNSSTFAQIQNVSNGIVTINSKQPYTNPSVRHAVTYGTQPYYPLPENQSLEKLVTANKPCLLYLDVWEQHITYLEHPACREVALGGPDTAARAKIVWQLRLAPNPPDLIQFPAGAQMPDGDWSKWVDLWQPPMRGLLKAQVPPQANNNDPCTISPASSYRGPENQLYRVEINEGGGKGTATFKWSRENGSVVFPITKPVVSSGQASTLVTLGNLGRDEYLGLRNYDWVEIVDDTSILQNSKGTLLQVSNVDPASMTVTLTGVTGGTVGTDLKMHPLLRRWDQNDSAASDGVTLASDGCVKIVEGQWLSLEYGIQIQFQSAATAATYRTGDYWLIPARVATGKIEWPPGLAALPPHGIDHHYAPLAVLNIDTAAKTITTVPDLRRKIVPSAT